MADQGDRRAGPAEIEPRLAIVGDQFGLFAVVAAQQRRAVGYFDFARRGARSFPASRRRWRQAAARRIEREHGVSQRHAGEVEPVREQAGQAEVDAQARRRDFGHALVEIEIDVVDPDMGSRQHGEDRAPVRDQPHAGAGLDLFFDGVDLRALRDGPRRCRQSHQSEENSGQNPFDVEFHAGRINARARRANSKCVFSRRPLHPKHRMRGARRHQPPSGLDIGPSARIPRPFSMADGIRTDAGLKPARPSSSSQSP